MGGGSTRSSSSSSNYSSVDNSYTEINSETHTYTDLGAIEAGTGVAETALGLAALSIESVGVRESQALSAMKEMGESAINKVAESYREADSETMQTVFKYSAVAAAVVGAAYAFRGRV